ncbi:unnamed protein product, partial [Staurois parvus]
MYKGKCYQTPGEWARDQRKLWMPFLGERPQEQWVTELDRLEIELHNRYQALHWHTEQKYLGVTTECSLERYDLGGPALLWESITDNFVFGDEGKLTLEDLRKDREIMFSLRGVSELEPDLEYLLMKDQHLERAYRQLLKHVQQHAQESAVGIPETGDLINVSAEEEPACAPPAEELASGYGVADLCPQ